jgi:hypothetical protein
MRRLIWADGLVDELLDFWPTPTTVSAIGLELACTVGFVFYNKKLSNLTGWSNLDYLIIN